jgi:trans-aconitate methyltransferase
MSDSTASAKQRADQFSNAVAYEKLMGRWSERLAPLFLDFAGLPEDGRILGVGCGTGALVDAVARRASASSIVGIDPSRPFIEYARHRFPELRFSFDCGAKRHGQFAVPCHFTDLHTHKKQYFK